MISNSRKRAGNSNTNRQRKGIQRVDLAYAQLAPSGIARDFNRDVILELIRTKQPVSRADLTRLSGLQPSTVSAIVGQLLQEQWITETGVVAKVRGRPSVLLSLNAELIIAVVDIRPTHATAAIVDLPGRFLIRETVPLGKDPVRGSNQLVQVLNRLIQQFPKKCCEGIGISLPGRIDPATQRLTFSPNLPWSNFDLKQSIEKQIPLQVEMDNAANACLLSELWYGRMDGVRTAVLITISEGIGAAVLANGQMVTGQHGLAGEFGHTTVMPDGLRCGCGRRGCWEVYASSRAALRYYTELSPNNPCPDIQSLLTRSEDGDKAAVKALTQQAEFLGRGLRNVVAALAPEVILLTGGITASWERFGQVVEAQLSGSMVDGSSPKIVITGDAELARLRGAAALVLQRHSGHVRSKNRRKAIASAQ